MCGSRFETLGRRVRFALAAAVCLAALASAGAPAQQRHVAGQLLVASNTLGDPRFAETVIYMIEHDKTGALGLTINRRLGKVSVATLLKHLGLASDSAEGEIAVHTGGPVEPGRVFILHSADVMTPGSKAVASGIAVTTTPDILRLIGAGKGPKDSLFVFGYAGWGPGQLDGELARADWFVVPGDPDLVFAAEPEQSWCKALKRRGVDL